MSEAYDPFALEEEVDYEDAESEDNEAEPAATGGSSPERSSTVAPVSDASLSGGDATDICGQKRAREHDPNDSEEAAADPNAISLSAQTPPSRVPRTEDEKWLWKSGNALIRQHMKKYRSETVLATKDSFDKLSKKLSQKVFEKEVERGTNALTQQKDSKRIQKYVDGYFVKYAHYYNDTPSA